MEQRDIDATESAVLSVLGGTPIEEAARQAGTPPARLAEAVLFPGGARDLTVPTTGPPGRRAVVYVWAPLPGAVPRRVTHQLDVVAVGATPAVEATVSVAAVDVASATAVGVIPRPA